MQMSFLGFGLVILFIAINCQCCLGQSLHVGKNNLILTGRYNIQLQGANWPGSAYRLILNATSTEITIHSSFNNCINDCKYYIGVFVDCHKTSQKYLIDANHLNISITFSTTIGSIHEFSFVKLTEANNDEAKGNMNINTVIHKGATVVSFTNISSQCTTGPRLLFIGDSFTAGYGVLGKPPCSFSAETEDITLSYAYLVAQRLHAEAHILPWSGKGVVRNYGDENQLSVDPMPIYYNRTIADVEITQFKNNYWNPHRYQPDVIVVMLGSNDYSTEPIPTNEQFINGFMTFVKQIQSDYSQSKILLLCAPSELTSSKDNKDPHSIQCQNTALIAKKLNVFYYSISDDVWEGGIGCDNHPNVQTQENMAKLVLPVIQSLL